MVPNLRKAFLIHVFHREKCRCASGKYPNDEERFLKTGKKRGKTREKARIWQDARLFEATPELFRADPDEKCEIIQLFGEKEGDQGVEIK